MKRKQIGLLQTAKMPIDGIIVTLENVGFRFCIPGCDVSSGLVNPGRCQVITKAGLEEKERERRRMLDE